MTKAVAAKKKAVVGGKKTSRAAKPPKAKAAPPAKPRPMPKWSKPSEHIIELFTKVAGTAPQAEQRNMFGCPVAFLNGNMFFSVHQSDLVLRLPEAHREQLIERGEARPFCPMPGMTMKEYVSLDESLVEDEAAVRRLFKDALTYAQSLPPKKKKVAKRKPG